VAQRLGMIWHQNCLVLGADGDTQPAICID
jgi:hypothetical protein